MILKWMITDSWDCFNDILCRGPQLLGYLDKIYVIVYDTVIKLLTIHVQTLLIRKFRFEGAVGNGQMLQPVAQIMFDAVES